MSTIKNLLTSQSNEWYTPAQYIEAAQIALGGIDLDPASNYTANKTVKAKTFYTIDQDGFNKPWFGNVFLNPPYGRDKKLKISNQDKWSAKLISEYKIGNVKNAILLVNATTETKWFTRLWEYPICFTDHRIKFYNAEGTPNSPVKGQAFIYLGNTPALFVKTFKNFGTVVKRY